MSPRDHLVMAGLAALGLTSLVVLGPLLAAGTALVLVAAIPVHLARAILGICRRRAAAAEVIWLHARREARHG